MFIVSVIEIYIVICYTMLLIV